MIATTGVQIHDIRDAEGFVAKTIRNSKLVLSYDEFEELKLEGICILYQLEKSYEPHMAGYAQPGRFSGYAARYLPGRLQDAWARQHPEHHCKRLPDGTREWEYGDKNLSIQQDDMPELVATVHLGPAAPTTYVAAPDPMNIPWEPSPAVASAISLMPPEQRIVAPAIVRCIDEGYQGNDEIARRVGLDRRDVGLVRDGLEAALTLSNYHAKEAA